MHSNNFPVDFRARGKTIYSRTHHYDLLFFQNGGHILGLDLIGHKDFIKYNFVCKRRTKWGEIKFTFWSGKSYIKAVFYRFRKKYQNYAISFICSISNPVNDYTLIQRVSFMSV